MALLNFLKNKKKAEEAKDKIALKQEAQKETKSASKAKKSVTPNISFKGSGASAAKLLNGAHITEKASYLASENKYVFNVANNANKIEVKKIIEKLYNVKVKNINMLVMPSKKRRVGRSIGIKSGFKKAIVTLPKDQKIDILAQ